MVLFFILIYPAFAHASVPTELRYEVLLRQTIGNKIRYVLLPIKNEKTKNYALAFAQGNAPMKLPQGELCTLKETAETKQSESGECNLPVRIAKVFRCEKTSLDESCQPIQGLYQGRSPSI